MSKYTVLIDVDDDHTQAITADRLLNLFDKLTNEEYLGVRLLEIADTIRQRHVFEPQERAAVEAVRENRKKPKVDKPLPPPKP